MGTDVDEGTMAPPLPVVPRLLVPLFSERCMCNSLQELAGNATHTVVVPSCATNQDCDGVRCTLQELGFTFHIELIVLPCDYAIQLVVQDGELSTIFSAVFNETGRRRLVILGVSIWVDAVIVARDFTMDVSVSVCV